MRVTTKTVAPYGSWRSPISIERAASTADPWFFWSIVDFGADGLLWIEPRPAEAGRSVVVKGHADGSRSVLTPEGFDARTRVHEYGGGAVWRHGDAVFFSNFGDSRVYRIDGGGDPHPVTPEPSDPNALRYADGRVTTDGSTVICVRESHRDGDVVNELVSFPADGSGEPSVVKTGRDFYAAPRIGADGKLAFLAWDQPLLPFLGCELWVDAERVAGGSDEAVFQPEWGPDGALYWVSDRDGWWNLYRDGEQLTALEVELGYPAWVFGLSCYAFLGDGRIVCTLIDKAVHSFAVLDPETRELENLDLPFTASIPYVHAHGDHFAAVAGSPTEPAAVVIVEVGAGAYDKVALTSDFVLEREAISVGRPLDFASADGRTAHAFYYPPASADFEGPAGELPPLWLVSHGGPTSQAKLSFGLSVQFLTSRGWGVVDVNYGGSTGFGRSYRELLAGGWGVVDLEDCVAAARHLAETGEVDARRLSIAGGSSGGYTTLLALARSDVFTAGTSEFGVADLVTFAETTHKFEARYLDWLVGPLPEALDVYRERSPITHADDIRAAVLIAQGLDDRVVPPSQAEQIVEALDRNRAPYVYLPFEGEGHGFRRRESGIRLLSTLLSFYGQVFAFEPADDVQPVEIVGL
jgi:dipeptidyl aminopeptidase/acylaminoacyl peptidase